MRSATLSTLLLFPFFTSCGSETHADVNPLTAPLGLENAQLDLAADNELTAAKAELGKKLFFDPRLSKSGKMGCVNCHHIDKAFSDGLALSVKDNGGKNSRNSPTMYNCGYYPELYWDGRKVGLESNVLAAWTGQLGGVPADVATTLNGIEAYKTEFQAAFKEDASETTIVNSLTSFLRTLRSGNSLYDQKKLSAEAKAGQELFSSAGCVGCHAPPLFMDKSYHNIGIGLAAENPDLGRANKTKDAADNGKFKTPTMRDVSKTAPYFHDGSVATLKEAVKLMASGGLKHQFAKDGLLFDRELTDKQIDQLVAFLKSLDNGVTFVEPVLPE